MTLSKEVIFQNHVQRGWVCVGQQRAAEPHSLKTMAMFRSHTGLNACKAVVSLPFEEEVVLLMPKLFKRLKKV